MQTDGSGGGSPTVLARQPHSSGPGAGSDRSSNCAAGASWFVQPAAGGSRAAPLLAAASWAHLPHLHPHHLFCRTYRAHGRINAYMSSPCHIELILSERDSAVKGEAVSSFPAAAESGAGYGAHCGCRLPGPGQRRLGAVLPLVVRCSLRIPPPRIIPTNQAGGGQAPQAEPQGAGQEAAQRRCEQEQLDGWCCCGRWLAAGGSAVPAQRARAAPPVPGCRVLLPHGCALM